MKQPDSLIDFAHKYAEQLLLYNPQYFSTPNEDRNPPLHSFIEGGVFELVQ
jgi:hypothetical protein